MAVAVAHFACALPFTCTPHDRQALGLPPGSDLKEVKSAYYKLAMQYHPDRSSEPGAAEKFSRIGVAYEAIVGSPAQPSEPGAAREPRPTPEPPPFREAFPSWVYRISAYLERVPQRLDLWLMPSYSSIIYQHLRRKELAEALEVFEEMRAVGEVPTHAVYEMLMRGCVPARSAPTV